ncbi:MAG: flavin oxidoreductase/NADH oxidase [Clostridia bacterium]|nr:flavin oxidoreductase/NADH oxidase [Clostridia bacterium]
MGHERFHYRTLEELKTRAAELGVSLPFAGDTGILATPVRFGTTEALNRLGIAPMEGADAQGGGSPSDYTRRRYCRQAAGGSAVIWFEAISVVPEGCSSATQLLITRDNLEVYKRLLDEVREAGIRENGRAPILVMQANHSGRYSNPGNRPAPLIAYRHPWLEQFRPADDSCIVTDDYLKALEERFGEGARLAREAGFDGVDIKSCHGYLFAELSSAFERPGLYGGSYENRTRLLKNCIAAAKVQEDGHFFVTCRLGIYDGYPEGPGFGASGEDPLRVDLREPLRLVRELREAGLDTVNITMGNPYATTHVTRPFDVGKYQATEHPLVGLDRMIHGVAAVKRAVPEMTVYASAPSYLRQYADLYAAGVVEQGMCDGMLFGRMAFADPEFAGEILREGRIHADRVCVTCGKCGDLIRAHKPTGCVVRDPGTFLPFYREFVGQRATLPENFRG